MTVKLQRSSLEYTVNNVVVHFCIHQYTVVDKNYTKLWTIDSFCLHILLRCISCIKKVVFLFIKDVFGELYKMKLSLWEKNEGPPAKNDKQNMNEVYKDMTTKYNHERGSTYINNRSNCSQRILYFL